ncbi:MAG: aminotransferase class I/II-fold pyridoxal phosphate-dependent enzyme [Gammaproteobacteria bacterium]|nr:aminotransferase class I/II-fold pyridoxal phosphate-dependent enzyme [Gammaproteobacteria bacterium]
MKKNPEFALSTHLIHTGEPRPGIENAVCLPIFQTANYESADGIPYHDICYARLSNSPNHKALHEKIVAIEGAESALVTSSGMAAISATVLTLLSSGDHFLTQSCLYGGTYDFFTHDLPALGIHFDCIDPTEPASWESKLTPSTKLIYLESISNPLLQMPNFLEVVRFAKAHGLHAIIDNTFGSPVNFQPIRHGFDAVLHSATKYLNGHSDVIAGVVAGGATLIENIRCKLNHLGGSLDPHACFLLHRGLKTLAIRMEQHNQSAFKIAEFLARHPAILKVNYPGLPTHPQHAFAKSLFKGFGGMVSFELKTGLAGASSLLKKIRLPIQAVSLGGVESLITRPAGTTHAGLSPEERARAGISDGLIRLSVGLEATADLLSDLQQALPQ